MSYPKRRSIEEQVDSGRIVWLENFSSAADALLEIAGYVPVPFEDRLAAYRCIYGRCNVFTGDPFNAEKGQTGLAIAGERIGVYVNALAFNKHQATTPNL